MNPHKKARLLEKRLKKAMHSQKPKIMKELMRLNVPHQFNFYFSTKILFSPRKAPPKKPDFVGSSDLIDRNELSFFDDESYSHQSCRVDEKDSKSDLKIDRLFFTQEGIYRQSNMWNFPDKKFYLFSLNRDWIYNETDVSDKHVLRTGFVKWEDIQLVPITLRYIRTNDKQFDIDSYSQVFGSLVDDNGNLTFFDMLRKVS